ncbi:MAG: hypothetical protein SVW57_07980 [Thermodesulfobacteriota bacterium]|nr:hypothetical protein [Thermodesulfobacteriota bacterium]
MTRKILASMRIYVLDFDFWELFVDRFVFMFKKKYDELICEDMYDGTLAQEFIERTDMNIGYSTKWEW